MLSARWVTGWEVAWSMRHSTCFDSVVLSEVAWCGMASSSAESLLGTGIRRICDFPRLLLTQSLCPVSTPGQWKRDRAEYSPAS